MEEYEAFRSAITRYLADQCWKQLIAKRIHFEQSLFEHSVNAMDVVLTYLPIFRQHWRPPKNWSRSWPP